MMISAELSYYPLTADYKPPIHDYISALQQFDALEVRTNALSTELFGEYELVMQAVQQATLAAFEKENGAVLVAKFLNRDRRGQ